MGGANNPALHRMALNNERLLSFDPLTGISEWHSYDEDTDTTRIRSEGDCEPFMERSKNLANDADFSKEGIKSDFWMYASIPPAIQVKWLIEDGIDVYKREHAKRVFKKLADPEYLHLKCTSGKHLAKHE